MITVAHFLKGLSIIKSKNCFADLYLPVYTDGRFVNYTAESNVSMLMSARKTTYQERLYYQPKTMLLIISGINSFNYSTLFKYDIKSSAQWYADIYDGERSQKNHYGAILCSRRLCFRLGRRVFLLGKASGHINILPVPGQVHPDDPKVKIDQIKRRTTSSHILRFRDTIRPFTESDYAPKEIK